MNIFLPFQRATLLMPSGPNHNPNQKHLYVILTDPFDDQGDGIKRVVLVNFTSLHQNYDTSCVIKPNEHRFIKHDSYVLYRRAEIKEVSDIQSGVANNIFQPHDSLDKQVFERVCKGLELSDHTTPRILQFFKLATPGSHSSK